jgi:hypothetical protein
VLQVGVEEDEVLGFGGLGAGDHRLGLAPVAAVPEHLDRGSQRSLALSAAS